MTAFPKLPDKPECLGFRKTIVLNKDEHSLLNYILDEQIKWCQTNLEHKPELRDVMLVCVDIEEKLNSSTPPPN